MGRLNIHRYDPRKDSSPGAPATDPPGLVIEIQPGECQCGCREKPKGAKAMFAMGHDARLRGKLIRAHVAGIPVYRTTEGGTNKWTPLQVATTYGWEPYLDAAKEREELRATEKAQRSERTVLARAMGPRVGDEKLIKIGRWEYTGRVIAIYEQDDTVLYEYVDRAGDVKQRVLPKSEQVL